jgi:hypothetical protein
MLSFIVGSSVITPLTLAYSRRALPLLIHDSPYSDMLEKGSSQPWPDVLEEITGSRNMTAQPLINYFQPLMDWLVVQNEGEVIGWDESACPAGSVVP